MLGTWTPPSEGVAIVKIKVRLDKVLETHRDFAEIRSSHFDSFRYKGYRKAATGMS
jgi:hypothetical protein